MELRSSGMYVYPNRSQFPKNGREMRCSLICLSDDAVGQDGCPKNFIGPLRGTCGTWERRKPFISEAPACCAQAAALRTKIDLFFCVLCDLCGERAIIYSCEVDRPLCLNPSFPISWFPAPLVKTGRFGSGLINETSCASFPTAGIIRKFILQHINKNVFSRPDLVMANV